MSKYPECDKLNEVANVQSTLIQFTEWLEEKGYEVVPFEKSTPVHKLSELVYEFMGIDQKKIEAERREMLAAM